MISNELGIELVGINDISSSKDFSKKSLDFVTSASDPILVKKQAKYNINRWAITGRSDQKLNLYTNIIANKLAKREIDDSEENIKRILEFHSSDLRTHTLQMIDGLI